MAVAHADSSRAESLGEIYDGWIEAYRSMLASCPEPEYGDYAPVRIGPTWQWDDGWVLPEFSLGWGVLAWCSHWLRDKSGENWNFTPEQARFVLWFYAVDEDGDWLNDEMTVSG